MQHCCFIVNKYPNKYEPFMLVFLQQLAWAMAEEGKEVSIICPLPVNVNLKYKNLSKHYIEKTPGGAEINVYMPRTVGFGQSKVLFGKSFVGLTTYYMEKAAISVIEKMRNKPDVYYGHFLAPAGIVAARLGNRYKKSAYFAYGEAHDTLGQFGIEKAKQELTNIKGVIAVSSYLKKQLYESGAVEKDKIRVFPNAIDSRRFYQMNKIDSRKKFNINGDDVIVSFVGAFNSRKGILRVTEAMSKVTGAKLICAGKGEENPKGDFIAFKGAINPEDVPVFNSAADFFVLPTLNEGCSNAIVEAMACGLPIISSDLPFNDDILNAENSIRIDPNNVEELVKSIQRLIDDTELRKKLSAGALRTAKELTLRARAKNIIAYIEETDR